ncbi:MAG: hypothetical protein LBV12_10710 [Puniceicoccales bacterium]|nr:hypothetical protein [Puniceicoccales bacterium]
MSSLQESTVLRQRLSMLEIANQALFELLQEKLSVSQDEVLNKMEIIRKRIEEEKVVCPKCRRLMSASRETCSYCGSLLHPDQPEDHWRP